MHNFDLRILTPWLLRDDVAERSYCQFNGRRSSLKRNNHPYRTRCACMRYSLLIVITIILLCGYVLSFIVTTSSNLNVKQARLTMTLCYSLNGEHVSSLYPFLVLTVLLLFIYFSPGGGWCISTWNVGFIAFFNFDYCIAIVIAFTSLLSLVSVCHP